MGFRKSDPRFNIFIWIAKEPSDPVPIRFRGFPIRMDLFFSPGAWRHPDKASGEPEAVQQAAQEMFRPGARDARPGGGGGGLAGLFCVPARMCADVQNGMMFRA